MEVPRGCQKLNPPDTWGVDWDEGANWNCPEVVVGAKDTSSSFFIKK